MRSSLLAVAVLLCACGGASSADIGAAQPDDRGVGGQAGSSAMGASAEGGKQAGQGVAGGAAMTAGTGGDAGSGAAASGGSDAAHASSAGGTAGGAGSTGGADAAGGSAIGGATSNPDVATFFQKLAEEQCQNTALCCSGSGAAVDVAACEAYWIDIGGHVSPASTFDPETAAACLAEIPTTSCHVGLPWSCGHAVTGPGKPGDTCTYNFDCQRPAGSGDWGCVQTSTSSYCYVDAPAKTGETCTWDGPHGSACVSPGDYCDHVTGTCRTTGGVGGVCHVAGGPGCLDGLYCNGSACVESRAVGQSCDAIWACVKGAYCTSYTPPYGECAEQQAEGAACTGNEQCQGDCEAGACTAPIPHADCP